MPCDYKKYPSNWKDIRARILERDRHRCKKCRVGEYDVAMWSNDRHVVYCTSETYQEALTEAAKCNMAISWKGEAPRHIVIVLTIAHLNHDAYLHRTNAKATRLRKRYGELNGEGLEL